MRVKVGKSAKGKAKDRAGKEKPSKMEARQRELVCIDFFEAIVRMSTMVRYAFFTSVQYRQWCVLQFSSVELTLLLP